jgi:hypothetical protein
MLRLRRSCPTLGWRRLLQRRHAGKSGHAQRTSCSSPDSIEGRSEADERGGGRLNEAETYQSVPLLALLC